MGTQRDLVVRKANHLGLEAAGYGLGTLGAIAFALGTGSLPLLLVIGFLGGSATAGATWRWLRHRGENGLRF